MSEPLQRRAGDGNNGDNKAPTLSDIYALLLELKNDHKNLTNAFVLDDLGKPDFTGHRLDHKQRIADAAAMQKYKTGLTKSLLDWAVKGMVALALFALLNGSMTYIREHLK